MERREEPNKDDGRRGGGVEGEERKGEGRKRGSRRNERGVKKKEELKAVKTDNHNCNVIWEREK